MTPTSKRYPDSAFNAYVRFSNNNLPLPRVPLRELQRLSDLHVENTINEVKMVLAFLADEEILAYGKWLDDRIMNEMHCYCYAGGSARGIYKVTDVYPPEAAQLLEDENPIVKNFKHEICLKSADILNEGLDIIDSKIWFLHERLKEFWNSK